MASRQTAIRRLAALYESRLRAMRADMRPGAIRVDWPQIEKVRRELAEVAGEDDGAALALSTLIDGATFALMLLPPQARLEWFSQVPPVIYLPVCPGLYCLPASHRRVSLYG